MMQVVNLPLDALKLTDLRPPRTADEVLVNAIKKNGIIEPIIVRPWENGYEVVEGLRRFDAAKKLGLESIPALIKNLNDEEIAYLFLVENIGKKNTISTSELTKEANSSEPYFDKNTLTAASTVTSIMKTGTPPAVTRALWR